MTAPTPIQDFLNFNLRADTVVVSDTVKVSVTVNTISSDDKSEDSLRSEIKAALVRLIPSADWKFSNVFRAEDASGYERVTLTATARVSEKENFKLDDRAKRASVQGLTLTSVSVDSTVPAHMLEKAERELRLEILKKAQAELKDVTEATSRNYRINNIQYHNQGDPYARKMAMATSNYTSNGPMGGGGGVGSADDDDGSLSNAQKVSMTATVTFAVAL